MHLPHQSMLSNTIGYVKKFLTMMTSYASRILESCMLSLNSVLIFISLIGKKNITIARAIRVRKSWLLIKEMSRVHGLDNLIAIPNTTESPLRSFMTITGLIQAHNLERQHRSLGNGLADIQRIGCRP